MVSKPSKLIVGLGEVLWDMLPAGSQLGGAAANFAVMASQLGDRAVCASRVGNDDPGRRACSRLAQFSVDTSFLQTDPRYPTGSASVTLTGSQPQYLIPSAVAWDFLELSDSWLDLARRADAVCFGTLAQRTPGCHGAIQGFLAATSPECVRVLDVNLRQPFYSAEILQRSLARATVLKMNDAEAPLVLDLLGLNCGPDYGPDCGLGGAGAMAQPIPQSIPESSPEARLLAGAQRLLERFSLVELVSITMGESGSLLVTRKASDRHPGIATRVIDTVGAGDAFAAAMTHFYMMKAPLAVINEAANRWGSWVASQPGAMPVLDAVSRGSIAAAIEWRSGGIYG